MTKYTDRVAEGKQFRTDVYGRRITDESVPKFIIAGAHTSSPDETWHTPKIAGPYRYPTKIEDTASWDAWTGAMMLDARMPAFVRRVECTPRSGQVADLRIG